MTKYQIWSEGYLCTGMEGIPEKAQLMGEVEANSFQEACDKLFVGGKGESCDRSYYDPKTRCYWVCRLFDNEADARKAFG